MFLADLTPAGAVAFSVALFSGSLVPFFLLVDVDSGAVWLRLKAAAGAVAGPSREAFRDAAALLILLTTSPKGAMA
jgi:hypothetical protein